MSSITSGKRMPGLTAADADVWGRVNKWIWDPVLKFPQFSSDCSSFSAETDAAATTAESFARGMFETAERDLFGLLILMAITKAPQKARARPEHALVNRTRMVVRDVITETFVLFWISISDGGSFSLKSTLLKFLLLVSLLLV